MSLYNDLNEVLTPYANKIKEVNESLDSIEPLVGDMMQVKDVYSGNIIDLRGKTAPASTLDGSIHFSLDDGTYYSNPFTPSTAKSWYSYPRKADGTPVKRSTDGGQTYSNFTLDFNSTYIIKIVVDGLNVLYRTYTSLQNAIANNPTHNSSFILEEKPAYWDVRASGYTAGDAVTNLGLTQGNYSQTYVEYVEPTPVNTYTEEFDEHITNILNTEHDIFIDSPNLVDYSKIIWTAKDSFYQTVEGYYIPVGVGDILVSNITVVRYWFYDSSKTLISSPSSNGEYQPVTAPENTAYMRVGFRSNYVSEGDDIMVWKAKSVTSAPYERPIYRPHKEFAPEYFDGNLFNYAVPQSLTQGVMRWARFAALRAMNEARDAYRFGTFNVYVGRGTRGFSQIRELLFDYGIDFCGFQECTHAGTTIGAAVYDWQFPYNSGQRASAYDDAPVVSRFEVVSTDTIALSESESEHRSCKIVKMNMPQNKHYPRVPTLSVYNYHGALSLSKRLTEIQTMLYLISDDTSDFIIIMGDTNSEVDSSGHRQSWDVWEAAGFTAVHHGESPTWPSNLNPVRYSSMDNIFVSAHINVLHYDIVNGTTLFLEDGTTYLSDHDFVFADLQFDFDAVLKNTWTEPVTV